jgi:hypothetical protein
MRLDDWEHEDVIVELNLLANPQPSRLDEFIKGVKDEPTNETAVVPGSPDAAPGRLYSRRWGRLALS